MSDEEKRSIPFVSPDAPRRKRLVELLHAFLNDKVSLAELKGLSKEKLFLMAEAGYVKLKHGRINDAEKIYQALIMLDHRNAYYHSVMGAIHQKKERPVEAILEYSRAIQIDKGDIACYTNRGEIYLRHKNFKKAAEDFRQAIVMDMSGKNLWANRARSLVIALKRSLELQRNKDAKSAAVAAAAKRPSLAAGPTDTAAKDARRFPKPGTPTPPTQRSVVSARPAPRPVKPVKK